MTTLGENAPNRKNRIPSFPRTLTVGDELVVGVVKEGIAAATVVGCTLGSGVVGTYSRLTRIH